MNQSIIHLAESSISIVVAATLGALSALLAAIMPEPSTAASLALMDDSRLRLICIAGSLGGAVLSVMLFKIDNHKELVRKLCCSSISGVVFSPIVIRHFQMDSSTDYVLAVSAVTALLSWSLLQILIPFVTKHITQKIVGDSEAEKPTTKL